MGELVYKNQNNLLTDIYDSYFNNVEDQTEISLYLGQKLIMANSELVLPQPITGIKYLYIQMLPVSKALETRRSLAVQPQRSAHCKAVLDNSLITVDTTSLGQHKLYYCTIALSLCEICGDVMVLIWKFAQDMPMNDTKRDEYHAINIAIN